MIHIKRMQIEDIDFVCQNEINFFKTSLGKEMMMQELTTNQYAFYYVFFDDEKRIGYLSSWVTIPQAEILNFFIISEYQGRGIGSMMLKFIINEFIKMGVLEISLEVRASNYVAQRVYEKMGFRKAHIRKEYYHDGEDAILMLKEV